MRKKEEFNIFTWGFRKLYEYSPIGPTRDEKARLKLSRESHLPTRPAATDEIREFTCDIFSNYYKGELSEKMHFWELCQALVKSEYVEKYGPWAVNKPHNLFTWKVEVPSKEELIESLSPYLEKIEAIKKKYDCDIAHYAIPDCYDLDRDNCEIIDMLRPFENQ